MQIYKIDRFSQSSCICNFYKQTLQAIISLLYLIQHYMFSQNYKGYLLSAEFNLNTEIQLILTFVESLIEALKYFYLNCSMQLNNHNNFIQFKLEIKKRKHLLLNFKIQVRVD
ncbi:unnamed protein product [Paramecium octaurelia]|uniref:Uncharacterized protein n=1 Tax=Paramecium octaurelia TaxID=43137 RepID=A0A8S1XHF6_PAROT|nr:unnamed protein product [Paramecium octaurelia]